jgi:hypothetical protein
MGIMPSIPDVHRPRNRAFVGRATYHWCVRASESAGHVAVCGGNDELDMRDTHGTTRAWPSQAHVEGTLIPNGELTSTGMPTLESDLFSQMLELSQCVCTFWLHLSMQHMSAAHL